MPRTRLVTPNLAEVARLAGLAAGASAGADVLPAAVAAAQSCGQRWRAGAVAVTLGERGAVLVHARPDPLVVPAPPVAAADPCGAGDRFAAAAAPRWPRGALVSEAVQAAVAAASAYVAAGGVSRYGRADGRPGPGTGRAAGPAAGSGADEDAAGLAGEVRAAGGTVVATGGCFDLLHAGHVATLQAAR